MFNSSLPRISAWVLLAVLVLTGHPVQAQDVTRQQLQQLAPNESDLVGFARLQLSKFQPSQDATGADSDYIDLNHDVTQWSPGRPSTPERTGTVSRIRRGFVSSDGNYMLSFFITLCDTPEAAREEVADFRREVQVAYHPGTLSGGPRIGDESWYESLNALLFRQGRMMVLVNGDKIKASGRQSDAALFPPPALEAAAYECLLKAAQQPELTGVSGLSTSVAVNGHTLPRGTILVGKQTYVPVREFARALGMTSGWDAKTGALTLTGAGRKAVALTAGSTAATVGGAKAAALAVPVLKDGGEPVMALSDLLTLTGGRVTGHAGNTVRVNTVQVKG